MSRMGFASPQNASLLRNENENDSLKNYALKNQKEHFHPLGQTQERTVKKLDREMNEPKEKRLGPMKNSWEKGRSHFQCHFEDRKRKAEMRRKKIIQKLKLNYEISIERMNENVTNELIRKMEFIEREKKEREKRNMERTLYMVTRLLEEQKYKKRGLKFSTPMRRKKIKMISPSVRTSELFEGDKVKPEEEEEDEEVAEFSHLKASRKPLMGSATDSKGLVSSEQEKDERESLLPKCVKSTEEEEELLPEGELSSIFQSSPRSVKSIPLEKCLECSPKQIIFQDYKRGEVYLQVLKITNISLETIHCRYLGIVAHVKNEERFPIGVAVRDSVKLRPGLSCSTKIRLCTQDDKRELECSIVYETRRKDKPFRHSFFFVPLSCIPARAIVQVSPLKINFPSLTWCQATGAESSKLLKKFIRIENKGGKECCCKIVRQMIEEKCPEEEIYGEAQEEFNKSTPSTVTRLATTESLGSVESPAPKEEEEEEGGEGESSFRLEAAIDLLSELIENVFATFRFSDKYHLVIPPFSTKQIEVRFVPEYKGFHQESHVIQFEDCHNCTEEVIELTGNVKKLPLLVEPQAIDLKTCIADSGVYAASFKVFNSSRGPYSIAVKIPPSMRRHAHVNPKGTIIQAHSSCEFSVRLYPKSTLSRDAGRYFSEDLGVLEFPIFIYSANVGNCKSDYVKIYLLAVITNHHLELSPSTIDFGTVSTLETVRTSINLTNRSLAIQEYAFLNLPKGVRVEPNMGFGFILPMETIPLHVLYSPGTDLIQPDNGSKKTGNHSFRIRVTSLAECGGFGEDLTEEEEIKSFESIWGEGNGFEVLDDKFFPAEGISTIPEEEEQEQEEEEDDDDDGGGEIEECGECYEDSVFFLEEELTLKKLNEETKIRNYLKLESETLSEHSFFNRMNFANRERESNAENKESQPRLSRSALLEEKDGEEEPNRIDSKSRFRSNFIACEAVVVQPICQLSESVIQLPSTPCSSFSLYRFRLKGYNDCGETDCTCGMKRNKARIPEADKFEASFEFQYDCPQVKLEPRSGFLRAGESLPVTIVYRPEFPADDLYRESRAQKAKKLMKEKAAKNESASVTQSKGKKSTGSNKKMAENAGNSNPPAESTQLEKYDFFAGERSLQELVNPFHVEARINCVIKMADRKGEEKREIHGLLLICPAVKPKFVYLGESQEINFDRVFAGTRARFLVEIQNISSERIRPAMSLLNPSGPFSCLSGLRNVSVDPEHVWCQPLTYAPSQVGGPDKEYFEIYCGSTSISLLAKGESVLPRYRMTPNFGCFLLEARMGSAEEIQLEVENLNPMEMKLQLVPGLVREGSDWSSPMGEEKKSGGMEEKPKEKEASKRKQPDSKGKKNVDGEKRNLIGWEETPEEIMAEVEEFSTVLKPEESNSIFDLAGVDERGELIVSPLGKNSLKIRFSPPLIAKPEKGEKIAYKKYAINYKIMLERINLLKEILIVGSVSKSK